MRKAILVGLVIVFSLSTVATNHVQRQDAVEAIDDAEASIVDVMTIKNETGRMNDSLEEARLRLRQATYAEWIQNESEGSAVEQAEQAMAGLDPSRYRYSDVLPHTREIQRLHDQIFNLTDRLRATESRLSTYDQQGMNVSEAGNELSAARVAYHEQRYDEMDTRLIAANRALDEARSERSITSLLAQTGSNIFMNYAREILSALMIILVLGAVFRRYYLRKRKKKRLDQLSVKHEAIQERMKETQQAYFVEDDLSKSVYEARIDIYRDRLQATEQEISTITDELDRESPL